MATSTIKVPNLTNADIPGLVTDPGTFFFNTDIDNLQYLDNAGNPVNVGNANAIAQEIIVNATDGNDANVGGPYATYNAALTYAQTLASPTYNVLIQVIGNQTITGDFIVSPYIVVDGTNSGTITFSGDIDVDPTYLPLNSVLTYVYNCKFSGPQLNVNWSTGTQNIVFFVNCDFSNVPVFANTSPNTNTFGNGVAVIGFGNLTTGAFGTSLTVTDALAAFVGYGLSSLPSVISTGSVGSFLSIKQCSGFGQITVDGTGSTSPALCFLNNNTPTGVNVISTSAQLITDIVSLNGDALNFSGGATNAQVQLDTDASPLKVTTSLYTPTKYTPTSPDSRIKTESIVSHLNGINNALPTTGQSIGGLSVNTALNCNTVVVVCSFVSRVENIATGSARVTFNATSALPTIIFNCPFTTGFTAPGQAAGSGNVEKASPSIGDGVVSLVESVSGLGLQVNMILAASSGSHTLQFDFSYQIF